VSDSQTVVDLLRKTVPAKLAEELVSVQPMDSHIMQRLLDESMSEQELVDAGYTPVCPVTRLMWIKK
jgi:hypothetical protein